MISKHPYWGIRSTAIGPPLLSWGEWWWWSSVRGRKRTVPVLPIYLFIFHKLSSVVFSFKPYSIYFISPTI